MFFLKCQELGRKKNLRLNNQSLCKCLPLSVAQWDFWCYQISSLKIISPRRPAPASVAKLRIGCVISCPDLLSYRIFPPLSHIWVHIWHEVCLRSCKNTFVTLFSFMELFLVCVNFPRYSNLIPAIQRRCTDNWGKLEGKELHSW